MPEGDEGEDDEEVEDLAGCGGERGCGLRGVSTSSATTERDVDVADDPAVEGAVPGAPEGEAGVVVGDAADHVLWGIDAVDEGPEAEEAPGDEKLEPDDVQVEEAEHA